MKTSFTTTDIVKGLKIPFGRLREWIVREYVKPSVPAAGSGKAAEFSLPDVYMIEMFRTMVEGGFTREQASKCLLQDPNRVERADVMVFRRSGNQITGTLHSFPDSPEVGLESGRLVYPSAHDVLDLKTGRASTLSQLKKMEVAPWKENSRLPGPKSIEDWDDIYVLNFRKIRAYVDSKMTAR